jgi:short subunit dehydrogenase-like uncharacterized protein
MICGLWFVDLMLYPGTPIAIRSFIWGFKWVMTWPVVLAAVAYLGWHLVMLIAELLEDRPKPQVDIPTPIQTAEQREKERLNRITEIESQKRKEEERIKNQEMREAKATEERARFHEMKQTRSADEAAKASLEEF